MNKEKSFLGEFTFQNDSISCEIENVIDRNTGKKISRLAMKTQHKHKIIMGYTAGEGLKLINTSRKKNNPLGEFLGLNANNLEEIKDFILKYGYLYEVKDSEYTVLNIEEFKLIQERLQAFIQLINHQSEFQNNNHQVLESVLYLLLKKYNKDCSNKILFPIDSNLEKLLSLPIIPLTKDHQSVILRKEEGQNIIVSSKFCSTLNKQIEFELQDIQSIFHDNKTPHWCKSVLYNFLSMDNLNYEEVLKIKIDFLFACIYLLNPFSINNLKINNLFNEDFNKQIATEDNFLQTLREVSKLLIKEEFERVLQNIKFTYNTNTMSPDWKLPSFIGALYFSVYYKNSKDIIYRICANHNCNQYFQVSSTNGTKKHCCDNCRDNKNARNSRARKKQGN